MRKCWALVIWGQRWTGVVVPTRAANGLLFGSIPRLDARLGVRNGGRPIDAD